MKIVIAGAGRVGTHLSKLLSTENHNCVLIDENEDRLADLDSRYDIMTYNASPTSLKALKEVGIGSADLFVGVTPLETKNITACILAHSLGAKKTVARIDQSEYLAPQNQEFFKNLGIDSLIYPEVLAADDIISGLKMSWSRQRWDVHDGALVLLGIKLRKSCEVLNQPLKDLCGPDDPYHVVAIKRGEDTIIPGGLD
jgi:trk system potassium uptake protein TrkA